MTTMDRPERSNEETRKMKSLIINLRYVVVYDLLETLIAKDQEENFPFI